MCPCQEQCHDVPLLVITVQASGPHRLNLFPFQPCQPCYLCFRGCLAAQQHYLPSNHLLSGQRLRQRQTWPPWSSTKLRYPRTSAFSQAVCRWLERHIIPTFWVSCSGSQLDGFLQLLWLLERSPGPVWGDANIDGKVISEGICPSMPILPGTKPPIAPVLGGGISKASDTCTLNAKARGHPNTLVPSTISFESCEHLYIVFFGDFTVISWS